MRKLLLGLVLLLLATTFSMAQAITISGTVTSAKDGNTIPGVNILIKGAATGTITDINGKYTLDVPLNTTVLVFSFIGYLKQEEAVGSRNVIDVKLAEEAKSTSEVVVTALGIEKNTRALGYAVQKVDGQDLVNARETNVVNGLAGKVAGMQITTSSGSPGASSSIRLRGTASLSGDYQPLFVIDGVPIDNGENASSNETDANVPFTQGVGNSNRAIDINPNDVESMTVLKGPAASALYGLIGRNGAIIIRTKRGSKSDGKPVFSYSSTASFDRVNKLPALTDKYSQGKLNAAGQSVYQDPSTGQRASWGPSLDLLRYNPTTPSAFDKNGSIVQVTDPNALGQRVNPYDNLGNFFQTGSTFDNSFSMSAGNEKSSYYTSVSHLSQNGIVPTTTFARTSIRFSAEQKFSDRLKASASINYVNSGGRRAQQGSNISGVMLGLLRTPVTFDNSNGYSDAWRHDDAFLQADGSQRNYRGGGGYDSPFFTVARNPTNDDVNRVLGYTQLDYSITSWLSATYRLGADIYSDQRKGGFDVASRAYSGGRVFQDMSNFKQINQDLIFNINKDIRKDLNLNANIGANVIYNSNSRVYAQGDGMIVSNFFSLNNTSVYKINQFFTETSRQGAYYDITLGYKNRYFLNTTGRVEQSSTLPAANNVYFFPSINGGYVFSEDLGLTENSIMNFGKLRAAFASSAYNAPAYAIKTIYGPPLYGDGYTNGVSFPFAGTPGLTSGTTVGSSQPVLGNANLKPGLNTTTEIGATLNFFKSRITVDGTVYYTKNYNQILLAPIASSSGYQYSTSNVGEITNKGLEIVLTGTPIKTPSFEWNIIANYSRNISRVEKLAPGVDNLFLNGFTGSGSYAIPGQPFGVIYGGMWARDAQGRQIIGADGYPVVATQQGVVGNPNPDFLLSIRNTFKYKAVTFGFLWDGRFGGKIYNGTKSTLVALGRAKLTENRGQQTVFNGVVEDAANPGKGTDVINTKSVPLDANWYLGNGGGYGNQIEDFMEDATWVRLREVTIAYSLPKTFATRLKLTSIDLSAYARNLVLFTHYTGVDPETNLTGTSNGLGIDYYNMPNTKSYGGTIRVTF